MLVKDDQSSTPSDTPSEVDVAKIGGGVNDTITKPQKRIPGYGLKSGRSAGYKSSHAGVNGMRLKD